MVLLLANINQLKCLDNKCSFYSNKRLFSGFQSELWHSCSWAWSFIQEGLYLKTTWVNSYVETNQIWVRMSNGTHCYSHNLDFHLKAHQRVEVNVENIDVWMVPLGGSLAEHSRAGGYKCWAGPFTQSLWVNANAIIINVRCGGSFAG